MIATWTDFVKKAQSFGYWAPAHDANENRQYNEGAKNAVGRVAKFTRDVDDAIVGGVGSVVGGVMGANMGAEEANKAHGWGALTDWGRFKDSMKMIGNGAAVGAKTGWGERNRLAHDIKTTAATVGNDFGIVPDATLASMQQANNQKILESMRRAGASVPSNPPVDPSTGKLLMLQGPEYEEYNKYVGLSNEGKNWGEAFLGAVPFAAMPARLAALPAMAIPAKTFQRELNDELRKGDAEQKDRTETQIPTTLKQEPVRQQPDGSVSRWSMSPELQDAIGYGLGGAILGGLFGGKGGWWKLGLLGLLLGALKNGGEGLKTAWGNIQGAWGGGK